MFTEVEKNDMKKAMTEGLTLPQNTNISDLTMNIWESIAKLPIPLSSKFNIAGNSSILNIINENNESIMNLSINNDCISFELAKPIYKFTDADRRSAAFATMTTIGVYNKLKYNV